MKNRQRHSTPAASYPPDLSADIARAERARDELRAVIREAHEARTDLVREVKTTKEEIDGQVKGYIDKTVNDGLERYKETLTKAMKDGRAAVMRKFDQIAKLMVGPRNDRTKNLLAALEIGTLVELIEPGSVSNPEAIALLVEIKGDIKSATTDQLERLAALLRPLVKEVEGKNEDSD